jgi:hypothetical protein
VRSQCCRAAAINRSTVNKHKGKGKHKGMQEHRSVMNWNNQRHMHQISSRATQLARLLLVSTPLSVLAACKAESTTVHPRHNDSYYNDNHDTTTRNLGNVEAESEEISSLPGASKALTLTKDRHTFVRECNGAIRYLPAGRR